MIYGLLVNANILLEILFYNSPCLSVFLGILLFFNMTPTDQLVLKGGNLPVQHRLCAVRCLCAPRIRATSHQRSLAWTGNGFPE